MHGAPRHLLPCPPVRSRPAVVPCTPRRRCEPLSEGAIARLLSRSAKHAAEGRYETFKTTSEHDATARHTEWLG